MGGDHLGVGCGDRGGGGGGTYKDILIISTSAISALLSIIGSSAIIFIILRIGKGKPPIKMHNRFLFGMSFIDLFNSISLGLTKLPMPRHYNGINIFGAVGTDLTCSFHGFFLFISRENDGLCHVYIGITPINHCHYNNLLYDECIPACTETGYDDEEVSILSKTGQSLHSRKRKSTGNT